MKYYTYDSNLRDRNKFTSTVNTTFGHRRYFSSLDTEIYFGSKQIDEIVAFDFTVAEPKLPIYGYNSYYANRIVSGRRTVQGTFAINFTNTMYLLNILRDIDDSILANDYSAMIFQCPEEDSTGLGIGNSAIFTKRFDITVSYGYGKSSTPSFGGCYQTLVGVQIVDYRQALDTEGNPILDMYSFIAKDIRYETAIQSENSGGGTDSGNGSGIDNNNSETVPTYLIANQSNIKEHNDLLSTCSNPDVSGFVVNPILYMSNNKYYLTMSIDTVNNETTSFKDVDIIINDTATGAYISVGYDSMKVGYKTQELTGALRESAAKIYNKHKDSPDQSVNCDISFKAILDNVYVTLTHNTFLTIDPNYSN